LIYGPEELEARSKEGWIDLGDVATIIDAANLINACEESDDPTRAPHSSLFMRVYVDRWSCRPMAPVPTAGYCHASNTKAKTPSIC
jgi:hypothetical protein